MNPTLAAQHPVYLRQQKSGRWGESLSLERFWCPSVFENSLALSPPPSLVPRDSLSWWAGGTT